MNRFPLSILSVLLAFLLFSCVKRPEGVLSDKETAPVIADLEIAEAYAQRNPATAGSREQKERIIEYVIREHGVTRAEFDSTMAWYSRNIDEYRDLYAAVDKEIAKKRKKMTGVAVTQAVENDLWPYSRHTLLSRLSGENALSFDIPAGTLGKGDRLVWKMRLRSGADATAILGVVYDNGRREFMARKLGGNRKFEISMQTDSTAKVKSVFGNMTLSGFRSMPLWIDSISLTTQPIDTMQYYQVNSNRIYYPPAKRLKQAPVSSDTIH